MKRVRPAVDGLDPDSPRVKRILARVAQYRAKKADESMVPSHKKSLGEKLPSLRRGWLKPRFSSSSAQTLRPEVAIAIPGTKKKCVALRLTGRTE